MKHSTSPSLGTIRWAKALVLFSIALIHGVAIAQSPTELPTRGVRFWAGFMQNGFGAQALRVHVLSTVATSGTVTIPLTGWSAPFNVAANSVAVVDVPTSTENSGSEAVLNKGVLVLSQDSVNVFISSYQNYTHDVSQVLPETSLGNAYRVDSYQGLPNFNNLHKSEMLIAATQDGTQVSITPSVNTLGGHAAGVPFVVDLNAGQTYQVQAATDVLDLTGTLVQATAQSGVCRPFVAIGGSMCATAPGACSACDHIFEQLVPLTAWGTRYFTAPVNGVTSSTYRILADQNNTSVTIGGGAPFTLNAGQSHEVNGTNTPVCVQSTLPVSVVQILEGYSCAGNGDPAMFIASPAERLSHKASFHTPTSPQLTSHSVSVIIPTGTAGQLTLDGAAVNPALFQSYAGCTDRQHAKVVVSAGVHRLQSAAGFQAYMFGMGYGESYAASVHDIGAIPVQQDSTVCGGGPQTLNAPEALVNALWTAASAPSVVIGTGNSITVTPTASESYTVTGELPVSGCPRSFTYNVGIPLTLPTLLTANGAPTINTCQYESVQLALVPPPDPDWFQIQWSPAGSLSDATIANPVATPMSSTWYRVEVSSPSGCGDMIDSILVQVLPGAVLDLSTAAQPAALCLGSTSQLASTTLRAIVRDDFDAPPTAIWTAIQGGTISNACGSMAGTALYFNATGQRYVQTIALNTTGGGHVRFALKIATGTAPCDDAEAGEGVVLEYSLNNGLNWSTLNSFNENAYPSFTSIDVPIPLAAQNANTMFRVRQLANSGAGQDNWALDVFLVARYDNSWLNYNWSPASSLNNASSSAPIATPTTSGWYTLHGTDPSAGCVYSDSVFVQVDPAFSLAVTPNMTLCAVSGTQLNATPSSGSGITYVWTPNNGTLNATNIANPIATPTATTTYTVNATTATGCTASGQTTITVGQLFSLNVTTNNDTLCQGQSAQLNAAVGGGTGLSYAWTGAGLNNSTIANPVATPAATTTYTCTVTHSASGCSLSQSITITITTGYTANAGPDLTLCSTLGHQLSVVHNVPGPHYLWSPAANLNSPTIAAPTIMSDVPATYTVTITDANGCSVSDQVVITRAFANLPAQTPVSACANTPPVLTAPQPGVSYLWSTGATTASITPTNSGPHTLTITDAQGCQGITTFNVTLFALPVVNLGADIAVCGVGSTVLNAGNAGSTYLWNTGATTQQITVTTSGPYSVTVTNANLCSATDAITVQLNPLPVDALQDMTACETAPPTLNAGNTGSTYLWNTTATTQSITPTTSGTYSVTVTTAQNCSATFDALITLVPTLTVSLGNDTSFCQGGSLTLDAGAPGSTYLWSTGATTQTISVTTGTTYSVVVSNGSCSATDAITVTTVTAPTDALTNVTQCVDQLPTLNAGNTGCTYLWNTGATTQTIIANTSNTYSVIVTNLAGCSGTFDAVVNLVQPPVVSLGLDTVLCEGETLEVDAGNPGASYHWSTGVTTQTTFISQSGTVSVTVNNGYCQRTDDITVQFNPSPARMAANQFYACLDDEPRYVILDAGNPGSRYGWSTGETSQVILAGAYGWYIVEVTNQYDCASRDSANVIEFCPSAIWMPNTFTPDGDGINDIFIPVGKNIATMHLLIFDRWGEMLFESDDPTVGWDGTYSGELVKNDMYVWRLTYQFREDKDGTLGFEKHQMGQIQVLR
ncbi:MAG: T9SS type B sorting domain-containing protein [Flavobacteriales bacterium]